MSLHIYSYVTECLNYICCFCNPFPNFSTQKSFDKKKSDTIYFVSCVQFYNCMEHFYHFIILFLIYLYKKLNFTNSRKWLLIGFQSNWLQIITGDTYFMVEMREIESGDLLTIKFQF